MKSLNGSFLKDFKDLKQEKNRKGKLENDKSRGESKKKR